MTAAIDISLLKKTSKRLIDNVPTKVKRYLYDNIDFESRLVILKGFRGVGKTTLLLQRLNESEEKVLFLSLDHLYFATNSLLSTIDTLYEDGYRSFAIDEVHKYENWSMEIKNIYDSYPDLKLLVTSSSALDISKGAADLSRRAAVYTLYGMSFREYLLLEHNIEIPILTFHDILDKKEDYYEAYYDRYDLEKLMEDYLRHGYYPFYHNAKDSYGDRLHSVCNHVIEIDLPAIFNIDYESTRQVKKLLSVITGIAPFTPNISKLSRDLKIPRNSILYYIDYMSKAKLINTIVTSKKSDSALSKPDKIFLENTNLLYSLGLHEVNKGTLRETYVLNALRSSHKVTSPVKGDFLLDNAYTIEVGGPNKTFAQVMDMPNPILIKDGITVGGIREIPMWLLGFLY